MTPTTLSQQQRGYIALIIVLTLTAVGLALGITVALLGIGEAQSSLAQTNGENTLAFVEGCMQDALLKTKLSSSYAGGTITRPEGTCSITVSKNGTNWTITATTNATTYTRTVQALIIRGATITISNWKEL